MAGHDVIGPFSSKVNSWTPCSRLSLRHASVSKLQTLQAAISVAEKCSGAREIADVCGVLSQLLSSESSLCTHRWQTFQTWQTLLIGTVEVAVQNTLGTQDQSSPAHPTDVLRDSMGFHGIPWLFGFKLSMCQSMSMNLRCCPN